MMNQTKTLRRLNKTICTWLTELDNYDLETLRKKPDDDSWSMGQVYVHLIQATLGYHLKQVEKCLSTTENSGQSKNFRGFITYHVLGSIPPIKVKVPPSDSYTPRQPDSKEQITKGLDQVLEHMSAWKDKLGQFPQGKTPHPGFSYLNADEWYKLIEMHFRHHLRQKNRIDEFLGTQT